MCRNLSAAPCTAAHDLRMRVARCCTPRCRRRNRGSGCRRRPTLPCRGRATSRTDSRADTTARSPRRRARSGRARSGREVRCGCAGWTWGSIRVIVTKPGARQAARGPRGSARAARARCRVRALSAAAPGPPCPRPRAASRWRRALRRWSRRRTGRRVAVRAVSGCGARTPKSVITARGPPPAPQRARSPCRRGSRRRAEIEFRRSCACDCLQHHEGLLCVRGDLRRAAGAGQARGRRVVGADHGAVEVAEAIDLRRAEEADVDAPGLQVVARTLPATAPRTPRSPPVRRRRSTAAARPGACRWCRTRRSARCPARASGARGCRPRSAGRCRRSTRSDPRNMRAAATVIHSSRVAAPLPGMLMPPSARGWRGSLRGRRCRARAAASTLRTSRDRARSHPSAGRRRCRARRSPCAYEGYAPPGQCTTAVTIQCGSTMAFIAGGERVDDLLDRDDAVSLPPSPLRAARRRCRAVATLPARSARCACRMVTSGLIAAPSPGARR